MRHPRINQTYLKRCQMISRAADTCRPSDISRIEFVGICMGILREQGFHVRQVSDPRVVRDIVKQVQKPYLTKILDPLQGDYTEHNCFWLVLYRLDDASQRPVGMLGARQDTLQRGEFVRFIEDQARRLYAEGGADALGQRLYPPPFYEIEGNTVYVGDLFIDPDFRGPENINLRALLLLTMGLAHSKWAFKWLYAFVRSRHADSGYFQRYCFSQTYPGALTWITPPAERSDSDYFGCVRDQDLYYLISQTLRCPGMLKAA